MTDPSESPRVQQLARRWCFVLLSFSSISLLLGHLYDVASFHSLGLYLGLPSLLGMIALWIWGRRSRDEEFLLRLRVGLIGGIWGTLGYDLVRIPLHLGGMNPFPPIRVYGMWLAGADHSTPWTDLLGFAYHFSNGITFAWIYALLMLRRHWAWGVAWGLLLEAFAVVTVFGEVFNIRYAPQAMTLAFIAHLFYGYPLGVACQRPEETLRKTLPLFRTTRGWLTVGLVAFCFAWFTAAWQPLGKQGSLQSGEIRIGPEALYPGCLDLEVGSVLKIRNSLPSEAQLRIRRPGALSGDGESVPVPGNDVAELPLENPGLHQILFPGSDWRSIVVFVHRQGDYRRDQ